MENKGYKPLQTNVLSEFSTINQHKKATCLLSLRNCNQFVTSNKLETPLKTNTHTKA